MAAIIKMLSSTHEAEVISAARALGMELTRNGKDWNDLGSYLEKWTGIADQAPEPEARPEPRPGRPAGPSWHRRTAEPAAVDLDEVKERVEALVDHLTRMKRNEQNFIEGMIERFDMYGSRTLISPAQRDFVYDLYTKYAENKGRYRR
jgi:hypothetical protein